MSFRLHSGIISLHSTVLADLVNGVRRTRSSEAVDSAGPVIRLNENGTDLREFFELIYDGGKWYARIFLGLILAILTRRSKHLLRY